MTDQTARLKVLSAGIFSLLLVLGVARFSYTPLLPLMQQQAGLGVAQAGWLAAINYAGYLSGALIASQISSLVLKDRLYRVGMLLAIVSTLVMGLTTNVWLWALSRYVAGLTSAAGMLLGTGLILNWLIRHHHRSELGIHFAGIGLGIAGCSAAVMLMHPWLDWRQQWWAFTAIGCVLLYPAPACINWDFIARRTGDLNALILAAVLQIVGILLPVMVGGFIPTLLGALLFGGTFIGMVSLVLSMAGRYYPTRPAKMMGKMTLSYGVAQIIGPAITGQLALRLGSYNAGLYFAAGVMAVGTLLLLALKVVEKRDAGRARA